MAIVQLTNAGAALLEGGSGPITLTTYQLGSDYNYTPEPTDTAIHGTLVLSGSPSSPVAASANVVRYSVFLDYGTGPYTFGELGLFTGDGTLFALVAWNELITKTPTVDGTGGQSMRLDVYLSMVGQNYAMWLDLAESNSSFRAAILGSPDILPQPQNAVPNMFVISGIAANQPAYLAFTDQVGLWSFSAYDFSPQQTVAITSFDNQSVTIPLADYVTSMAPQYLGQIILEFFSGTLYGTCRYVSSAVISGNFVTLGFDNPLMTLPTAGDLIGVFVYQDFTDPDVIPIATTTNLGGIIVGNTLTITAQGVLNVADTDQPVTSVNGLTGVVELTASDIPGLATVATTGSYTDLLNKPTPYSLPVASTTVLGGVKAPLDGNLTINGLGVIDLGFTPVTSVNGQSGAVTIAPYTLPAATTTTLGGVIVGTGLAINAGVLSVDATAPVTSVSGQSGAVVVSAVDNSDVSGTSLISDSGATTGTIKLRTIVAGTGVGLSLDTNNNLEISNTAAGVTSFNTRTGAIVFQVSDLTGVGGALLTNVAAAKYYDVPGGAAGAITASQLILEHVAVRTITWNANFSGSYGYASVAATASTTFTISVAGSQIGTMVFAAGATTATFTLTGGASINPGQVLTVTGPSSPDLTLANVTFTLLGLAT